MKQTNSQLIDKGLLVYGGLVTITLLTVAISNLKNTSSLVTIVIFSPVALYFVFKASSTFSKTAHKIVNIDQRRHPYFGNFSILTFVSQSDTSFLVNLVLLSLAVSITMFKISLKMISQ